MNKMVSLLHAAALFSTAHGAAWGEDRACKFVQWGYSCISIEQQGEVWTYLLIRAGNWHRIAHMRFYYMI